MDVLLHGCGENGGILKCGHWSFVIGGVLKCGHWSFVIGHWSLGVFGEERSLVISERV
jgi:hypothetical protein